MFPVHRPRRLRDHPVLRAMSRETRLHRENLIYPLFAVPGRGVREEIESLPGQYHLSVDRLGEAAKAAAGLGIPAVLLFGIPEHKDEAGSGAWAEDGIVQQATRAVKHAAPELAVITDLCLCEYTSHGHCGVLRRRDDGLHVDNDATLPVLARIAVSQARAGADMVAPSDMMDGRVAAIRQALDTDGFPQTPILAYAAKQASAFYGPFRQAADSAPQKGDRAGYQMDAANGREALRELEADAEEGADILLVKPALPCLDILRQARERCALPLAAYQVSGEYAMIHAAAARGWIELDRAMWETLIAIRRAGADLIVTYFAPAAARMLERAGRG